jgi:hypothetical protein
MIEMLDMGKFMIDNIVYHVFGELYELPIERNIFV